MTPDPDAYLEAHDYTDDGDPAEYDEDRREVHKADQDRREREMEWRQSR